MIKAQFQNRKNMPARDVEDPEIEYMMVGHENVFFGPKSGKLNRNSWLIRYHHDVFSEEDPRIEDRVNVLSRYNSEYDARLIARQLGLHLTEYSDD